MAQQGMRDRFTYTPGDGYVYRWAGGPWITIHKIEYVDGARMEFTQPDVIAVPESTTSEQLTATVDAYRLTHP